MQFKPVQNNNKKAPHHLCTHCQNSLYKSVPNLHKVLFKPYQIDSKRLHKSEQKKPASEKELSSIPELLKWTQTSPKKYLKPTYKYNKELESKRLRKLVENTNNS